MTFEVWLDQSANVTWYLNFTVMKTDYGNFSSFTWEFVYGVWNVTVYVENAFGYDVLSWIVNVEQGYGPPEVIGYSPSQLSLTVEESSTILFEIYLDRTANVSWIVSYNEVAFYQNVLYANYTLYATTGSYVVTALAYNGYGGVNITWTVNVVSPSGPSIIYRNPNASFIELSLGESIHLEVIFDGPVNSTWYINGQVVKADYLNSNYSDYLFVADSVGTFNVTVKGVNNYGSTSTTWIIDVVETGTVSLGLSSYSPSDTEVNVNINTYVQFSIEVNLTANVTWYVDGSVYKSDLNVLSSSFSYYAGSLGYHEIKAVASRGGQEVTVVWSVYVKEPGSSEPSGPFNLDSNTVGLGILILVVVLIVYDQVRSRRRS